jgi:hypothetical protein
MKDTDRAFPVPTKLEEIKSEYETVFCITGAEGMTLPQYAAIKLRVPRSGDPKLDAMIRESRRADFMQAAMGISVDKCMSWPDALIQGDWRNYLAGESGRIADAMDFTPLGRHD